MYRGIYVVNPLLGAHGEEPRATRPQRKVIPTFPHFSPLRGKYIPYSPTFQQIYPQDVHILKNQKPCLRRGYRIIPVGEDHKLSLMAYPAIMAFLWSRW